MELHALVSKTAQKMWKELEVGSYNAWTLLSQGNESTDESEATAAGFVNVQKQWACQSNKEIQAIT